MKKILFLLIFSLFATFSKAQVGIRYVSGVPTAATYTPNISKKESTVVYSTTAFKLYRWDGSGWLEVINSSAGTTYTAGTGINITGSTISNTSLNTDNQTLTVSGNTISISGGNSQTLPSGGNSNTIGDTKYSYVAAEDRKSVV